MENEAKKRQRRRGQEEQATAADGSGDEKDAPSPHTSKDRGRPKGRKPRAKSPVMHEDIIDGFAFCSFRTVEDLEDTFRCHSLEQKSPTVVLNECPAEPAPCVETPTIELEAPTKVLETTPTKEIETPTKDKGKQSNKKIKCKNKMNISSSCDKKIEAEASKPNGIATDQSERSSSRDRLSDVSTHSSSGRGYLCDSEGEGDRISDCSSDLFTSNHKRDSSLSASSSVTSTLNGPVATTTTESIPSTCTVTTTSHSDNIVRGNSIVSKPGSWTSTSSSSSYSTPTPLPSSSPSRARPASRSTPSFAPGPQRPPQINSLPSHSMFAPPIPPPPPLTSNSLPGQNPSLSTPFSLENPSLSAFHQNQQQQELLKQLNNQFLVSQDRMASGPLGQAPFLRTETHQHQHMHQHQHQHMHQHTYSPYAPQLGAGLLPPQGLPHMKPDYLGLQQLAKARPNDKFDKFQKFDSPFYRPGFPGPLQAYPGLPPMLHPTAGPGNALGSGLHGAFQPKTGAHSLQHTQLLMSLQEREKAMAATSLPHKVSAPPAKPPGTPGKSGKWCIAHVRVAYEIYNHQQKQQADQKDGKPADLRPPNHLLPSSIHRPPDGANPPLLAPGVRHNRSPFDGPSVQNPLITPSHLPPFARPSPYAGLANGLSNMPPMGSSLFGQREVPGMPSPHDWGRLHRTPPSFPHPLVKLAEERDREIAFSLDKERRELERERELEKERERQKELVAEREKERERERDRERDREMRERERDGRLSNRTSPDRNRRESSDQERGRERERLRKDTHRSRSRSPIRPGSPVRNGERRDSKDSSAFISAETRIETKVKQESKDDDVLFISREKEKQTELPTAPPAGLNPHLMAGLNSYDRSRLLHLGPYAGLQERGPHHPAALWSPFDRSLMESITQQQQRMMTQMSQRELIERERERMIHQRFSNPLGSMIDHERLREREMLIAREQQERSREFERFMHPYHDRVEHDRSKIPPLRPDYYANPFSAGLQMRPSSPVMNHVNSTRSPPSSAVGVPPPLIPSTTNRAGSPAKPKSSSPQESRPNGTLTDHESHSR